MILPYTSVSVVIELREEYEATNWVRDYMPHRHWMQNNDLDMSEIPDELHYQELEKLY